MLANPPTNQIGKRYLLRVVVGKGGMGEVYRAFDRLTGREVALKRVLTDAESIDLADSHDALDFRMALAREFKLSASLRHPNIITVLDYGFDEQQQPYYTMEMLLHPFTILEAAATLPMEKRFDLILQMLQALVYLHRRGIIHRDLKPANVLVMDGRVNLLDFGLSTMHERQQSDNAEEHGTAGTLAYMAPENLLGFPPEIQSDLYAVGMMAYEMIAGFHPFSVENPSMLINEILITMPDTSVLDVDPAVADVIARLLRKDPAERYANATETIEAFVAAANINYEKDSVAIRESFLQAARLVGRDEELQVLSQGLAQAVDGKGSAYLIAGESGVGKSRLVDELRTQAMVRGAIVMRGQAVNIGSQPYQVWYQVLRWVALLVDQLTDEEVALCKAIVPNFASVLTQDVSHVEPSSLPPDRIRSEVLRLLERALRAHDAPMLILLEDIHWAGSESLDLLVELTRWMHELPLMVVATYRDDEQPTLYEQFSNMQLMKLERLDHAAIVELSVAMLGDAGRSQQVVDLLQRETEGNVFFVVEVVRALAEDVQKLEDIGRMTLPSKVFAGGVQTVVQRRLNKIDEAARDLLLIAAIMGRELDLDLLASIAPEADIRKWLADCAAAAVLSVDDNNWSFAHDKLRLGLLDTLAEAQRAALHLRVATTMEATYADNQSYYSSLAYHFGKAGDPQKEEKYVTYAGEQALRIGAFREAVVYFQRALGLLPSLPISEERRERKSVHLQQRMGEAHVGFGDYDEARRLFQLSLELMQKLGDPIGIAVSLGHLGNVASVLEEFDTAHDLFTQALAIFRAQQNQAGIVRTLNQLGDVAYERGDDDTAKELYQESLQLSREIGEDWGMAGASRTRAIPTVEVDDEDVAHSKEELIKTLQAHMAAGNDAGAAEALFRLGVITQELGQLTESALYLRRAIAFQEHLKDAVALARSQQNLGILALLEREFAASLQHFKQALQTLQSGNIMGTPLLMILMDIARLHITSENGKDAMELLAFVLYHPDSSEAMQDEAENLIFALEDELDADAVAAGWESGKQKTAAMILKQVLES